MSGVAAGTAPHIRLYTNGCTLCVVPRWPATHLKLQNAEAKRTATKTAQQSTVTSKCTASMLAVLPLEPGVEGPLAPFVRKS
eukprot:6214510-Pleurochrysis_carterae.AAC.5